MRCEDRYFVASRDHAFVNPRGSRVFIAFDDDSSIIVSPLDITAIEEGKALDANT
jgi:hypothetical protein